MPFLTLFKISNLLIIRNFRESRRAELSRVSEEIDYFVSMTMPGGRIYRGFLPLLRGSSRKFSSKSLELHHNLSRFFCQAFLKPFKISNLLIFRNFRESRRAELSRVSEEIDYFVSMTMPGGRIYRGFLPLLRGSSRKFSSKSLELHHNNVWPNEKRH